MVLELEIKDPVAVVTGARLYVADNKYASHAWVETGRYIIDITSDQFGEAPVLLLASSDGRYTPGKEGFTIDKSINGQRVVESLLEEWLALS